MRNIFRRKKTMTEHLPVSESVSEEHPCNILPDNWQAKRSDGATRDSLRQEYEVYNSVIDSIVNSWLATDEMKLIVIAEHTRVEQDRFGGAMIRDRDLKAEFGNELEKSTADDFVKRNNRDYHLIASWFHLSHKCVVLTDKEEKQILGKEVISGWNDFYRHYPNSGGILRLSRVGFNNKFDQAIVYLEREMGILAGRGYYLFLKKDKHGKWRIQDEMLAWMS